MFGNITRLPTSDKYIQPFESNGFNSLVPLDENQDGQIDARDPVWSKLRVWVDTCHCGKSEFGKLYTLDELGIESIGIGHVRDTRVDKYGNQMRFKGTIRMKPASPHIIAIYDVFFLS